MNLIFTSFHYNNSANKAHHVSLSLYEKNIFTSLLSAKIKNPNDKVALIVTESTFKELDLAFIKQLEENNIDIMHIPFDNFRDRDSKIWSFSLYRLSIIYYLTNLDLYSNICSIDSDTFTVDSFEEVWSDCDNFLLLLDLNHRPNIKQAKDHLNELKSLYNEEVNIVNYGGEFICGSSKNLKIFVEECLNTFNDLLEKNIEYTHGDETVMSISMYKLQKRGKLLIKNASPYVSRYWTQRDFYLVSNNCLYNPVCIYHVPGEKNIGLHSLYKYYFRHKKFPETKKVCKMLNIYSPYRYKIKKIIRKIVIKTKS